MAQNVTLYNLLISCPGDIKEEVTLIESAVDEFNELYAETLGITIKTRHWSKSSYAQSGGKPQALLNEQFVNKCDAAVAIFWTRFGSPTDEYGSGTEEEIEIMLQSGKQVFMYFSDKPIPPSKINGDGYEKIQAFRDKYKDKGIYFTYSSDEEFKKMFFAHLSMHFLTEKRVSETANEYRSELKLLGIDETGRLTEEAVVCPFVLNAEITMKEYITSIKNMYQEISDMNVGGRSVTANTFFAGFTSPVDIDEDEKEFITAVAEQLERKLSDSFFELGNLNQDTLTSNLLSGPKLNGTSEEKQKYWKIKRLHETISKALEWAPVEKAFSGMNCIKLAIQNCGKAIDEDAEIMFEVPKESLLTLGEFPKFNNAEIGYLLTDCDMSILFGIEGTSEYIEYSESEQNGRTSYGARPYGLPGYVPDYSDDFTDEIKDVFCYAMATEKEKELLIKVFQKIEENIQQYSVEKLSRYSNAMSGIGLSSLIEEWIVQNELTEKIYTETELLYVITELYLQICGDFRYQEHIQSICKKWIDGQTPMEINNKETIGIAEVESLCNKRISYEMNFLIGNICDLIEVDGENEEQVDQRNILTLLQKKVKYGVPNMTAISICESVFNDRLLAIELAQILSDANIGTDKILNMLKAHSEEIFSCLDSYPEYFKDRLSVLMK